MNPVITSITNQHLKDFSKVEKKGFKSYAPPGKNKYGPSSAPAEVKTYSNSNLNKEFSTIPPGLTISATLTTQTISSDISTLHYQLNDYVNIKFMNKNGRNSVRKTGQIMKILEDGNLQVSLIHAIDPAVYRVNIVKEENDADEEEKDKNIKDIDNVNNANDISQNIKTNPMELLNKLLSSSSTNSLNSANSSRASSRVSSRASSKSASEDSEKSHDSADETNETNETDKEINDANDANETNDANEASEIDKETDYNNQFLSISSTSSISSISSISSEPPSSHHSLSLYALFNALTTDLIITPDMIMEICRPSHIINHYGIAENQIEIGDLVKLTVRNDNHQNEYLNAKITNIIPDVPGSYTFVYESLSEEKKKKNNNLKRGFEILNSVGISSVIKLFKLRYIDYLNTQLNKYPRQGNYYTTVGGEGGGFYNRANLAYNDSSSNSSTSSNNSFRETSPRARAANNLSSNPPQNPFTLSLLDIMKIYLSKFIIRPVDYVRVNNENLTTTSILSGEGFVDSKSNKAFLPGCNYQINHYSKYVGMTKDHPIREINDNIEGPIKFDSRKAGILGFHYYGLHSSCLIETNLTVPPNSNSLICGYVQLNNRGEYEFSRWTTVTPQFLHFYTLIYWENKHKSTREVDNKRKLQLINVKKILASSLMLNEKINLCHKTIPYFCSSEIELASDFYNELYRIVSGMKIDEFKELVGRAVVDQVNHRIPSTVEYQAALLMKDIAWFLF